ncbi:MAG: type III pantothenate kinase [Bacilli bacterium]|nr:type III pantothenate kinase [Bacilli bacterium]
MLLCLDIGNTHIVMGITDNNKIKDIYRFATNVTITEDEYAVKFLEVIKGSGYNPKDVDGVIISSVVPGLDKVIYGAFKKYFHVKPLFVGQGIKSGMNIKIENPKQLGADLLVGAVASYTKFPENLIVVDLGTATKFVVVNGKGEILGGAIAPGIQSSLNSLFASAAKLSQVNLEVPKNVIGRDTTTCIQSGTVYGAVSMVEGMVERIKKELGDAKVILTGGLSEVIKDVLNLEYEYIPNLLIEGLIILYNKNK